MNVAKWSKQYYVFGYVNPDTDGVGSAICYAHWLTRKEGVVAKPVIFGAPNRETLFVLDSLGIPVPTIVTRLPDDCAVVLVDTHHLNQLPEALDPATVVEILDHHPAGNPEAFPNARIQNEAVGAVATLVAEKYRRFSVELSPALAGLLCVAILSNTLWFRAPTTTERDREAVAWLNTQATVPAGFIDNMFRARSDLSDKSTVEVLLSDYKQFEFSGVKVGIAQLETTDLESFLRRVDLEEALHSVQWEKAVQHIFFNGADILREQGVLVAPDFGTRRVLEQAVQARFVGNHACFDRILLRKTDLVPQLLEYFETKCE